MSGKLELQLSYFQRKATAGADVVYCFPTNEHAEQFAALVNDLVINAELSPDDNSDTVPMPRELTSEQAKKAHATEFKWKPAPEHLERIKHTYSKVVEALHPVSDARGDSE